MNRLVDLVGIPTLAAGLVPIGERFIFGPSLPAGVATSRFVRTEELERHGEMTVAAEILTVGTHANFVLSVETSDDGVSWRRPYPESATLVAGTTMTAAGIGLTAAAAGGNPGFRFGAPGRFVRVGFAGDDVAADGTARLNASFNRRY